MVLSRGYVAEKEDETEGEDEGGGNGVRGTRESRTYAGPYRRVHIRRLEANREKAERADGKEKKMPDSQDPWTPSGGGERAYVSNAEEISCGLTSRSVDLRDRPLPTRPICAPPALVD